MPRMIYEYTKSTLEKVSIDPIRFERELNKASKVLSEYELESLSKWLQFYTEKKTNLKQFANCLVKQQLTN
jgi:hypothetical protein